MAPTHRHSPGIVAAICLSLAATSLPAQQPSSASLAAAKTAMAAGLQAMQKGDLATAHQQFARVVRLAPQVEPGHAALGGVLLAQRDYNHALHELEAAHKLDPADLAVRANLGRTLTALNRYPEAVADFQACVTAPAPLALSVDETIAYATALSGTREASAALDLLQHAIAQAPDSAPLNDALGTLIAQTGHVDQAAPYFERATQLDPTLVAAQLHLAVALIALNRPEDAVAPATLAATALPESFEAQLQLGRALAGTHRDSDALVHLHRATELRSAQQQPDALYALALALQASGDPAASLPLFTAALAAPASSTSFDRSAALTNLALAHVQTGDAVGALPLYTQALAAGPDSATLREDFGAAYLQKADLDHAIEQFKAGLAVEPDNPHLHYDLGLAYKLKDNLAAAVPEFERSAALDPSLPDPAFTLGVIYMQQGRSADSVTSLRRATVLQPENGDAWALLGSVLKDAGDPTGAAEALRHAIQLQPDQPSLHIQLATLEAQAGNSEQAAAERKTAAALSRAAMSHQRAEFALKSGRTLLTQSKLPEAILQLNAAASAEPTLVEPHTLLAEAYARQGKSAEAALERRQASELAAKTTHP